MTNWKKTNGKPPEPIMMYIEAYKIDKLNKQASIQRQIDKLNPDRQKIVYGILEMLLDLQEGEKNE